MVSQPASSRSLSLVITRARRRVCVRGERERSSAVVIRRELIDRARPPRWPLRCSTLSLGACRAAAT